jgi:hypothetical protein
MFWLGRALEFTVYRIVCAEPVPSLLENALAKQDVLGLVHLGRKHV